MAKKIKTPGKDDDLSVSLVTWPKGKTIDRIHWSQYGAAEFNPGKGVGRFSPFTDRAGRIIPMAVRDSDVHTHYVEQALL
ncbi:hypothetical protein IV493_06135 [Pantoea sp. SM3640]|uniref:hypothetical protein n=1 Tax=Pantoea sp. SM3640 TaxID=2787629 RepID=UPI0018A72F86|nr:hypothetical protein [Pantoea sp. SM3640]QPG28396.1 hypothetical protein IV493_06135 [Pantoea sp. SM3640]